MGALTAAWAVSRPFALTATTCFAGTRNPTRRLITIASSTTTSGFDPAPKDEAVRHTCSPVQRVRRVSPVPGTWRSVPVDPVTCLILPKQLWFPRQGVCAISPASSRARGVPLLAISGCTISGLVRKRALARELRLLRMPGLCRRNRRFGW